MLLFLCLRMLYEVKVALCKSDVKYILNIYAAFDRITSEIIIYIRRKKT